MFDVVVKDGLIIDGARSPRYRADIGIRNGVIAEIGHVRSSDARKIIDASGLNVAPGFIDLHTHYDAQIFWDPYCSVSGWHGITSVVMGNCGFGFAPVAPEMREQAMLSMSRNEAIPANTMRTAMPWDWVSFPEYLDSVDRTPKSVNVMSYMPLTPTLIWVLGFDRAKSGAMPTDEEHAEMRRLLHEAMDAGAVGWSVQRFGSENNFQRDYDGTPMATDFMHDETALELAKVLGERNQGFIQMTLSRNKQNPIIDRRHTELLAEVSRRPVLWNAVFAKRGQTYHREVLAWLQSCVERGVRINAQAVCVQMELFWTLEDWNLWDATDVWREVSLASNDEKLVKLADPAVRAVMKETPVLSVTGPINDVLVKQTFAPQNKPSEGLTLGEIAARTGKDPIDALCDIVLADNLKTVFYGKPFNAPASLHREVVEFDHTIAGVSDGGAHTKFQAEGRYPTEYMAKWVREHGWITLEDAHYRLSGYPAFCAGIRDRGVIREGAAADIIVYDYEKLDVLPPQVAFDLPADEWRRIQKATGYRHVLVNGEVTIEDDEEIGATPGELLRNGVGSKTRGIPEHRRTIPQN